MIETGNVNPSAIAALCFPGRIAPRDFEPLYPGCIRSGDGKHPAGIHSVDDA